MTMEQLLGKQENDSGIEYNSDEHQSMCETMTIQDFFGLLNQCRSEILRLRKENEELKQENEPYEMVE